MEQLSRFTNWLGGGEEHEPEQLVDDDDPHIMMDLMKDHLQQYSVLLEYERLQDLVPTGMYVLPAFDSIFTWHGTMFVQQGFYRGGVFKFELELPDTYPEHPPSLRFLSPIYHPMVELGTGRIDISFFFPEWKAGRDYASCALPHLHRLLYRREYFASSARPPLNLEARELFVSDPATFASRASDCARQSLENIDRADSSPSGCEFALQFHKHPAEAHSEILTAFHDSDQSATLEERKTMFVEWFCDHYVRRRLPEFDDVEEDDAPTGAFVPSSSRPTR